LLRQECEKRFACKYWKHTLDEEIIEEERLEVTVLAVGGSDVVKEDGLSGRFRGQATAVVGRILTLMMHPPRHIRAIPA